MKDMKGKFLDGINRIMGKDFDMRKAGRFGEIIPSPRGVRA